MSLNVIAYADGKDPVSYLVKTSDGTSAFPIAEHLAIALIQQPDIYRVTTEIYGVERYGYIVEILKNGKRR